MNRKEVVWIDWAKFISMFFVYWCHVDLFSSNSFALFPVSYGSFFVNIFYFISGYLLFSKFLMGISVCMNDDKCPLVTVNKNFDRKKQLFNIFFKIAIPSIIFSLIMILPKSMITGGGSSFLVDSFVKGTYWFTCSLCVAELILLLLTLINSKNIWLYLLISILLAYLGNYLITEKILIMGNEYLPWFYKQGLLSVFFLCLGGVFYKYEYLFDICWSKVNVLLKRREVVGIFLILCYYMAYYIPALRHSRTSLLYGFDLWGVIYSMISIAIIIALCKLFASNKMVKYVSRHTIGLYFLSAAIPFAWAKLIDTYLPINSICFVLGVVGAFLTSLIIVYIMDRYIPFVFDVRILFKNNRKS